jgi:hypothetical protein
MGPGKVFDDYYGAPSQLRIAKLQSSRVVVWVEAVGERKFVIWVDLNGSDTASFSDRLIYCSCSDGSQQSIAFDSILVAAERAGVGYQTHIPSEAVLVPKGRGILDGQSQGSYWVQVALPACAGKEFTVGVPAFRLGSNSHPEMRIAFKLKSGRFMHAEQIL